MKHGEVVLCNSLEWTEWKFNPVQVELCDACGTTSCASGGYVHISVIQDFVLWTMPAQARDAEEVCFPATAIERFGSVAFPAVAWESFRNFAVDVPPISDLTRSDGRVLRDAWAIGQSRPKDVDRLLPLLRSCLLGADTLDVSEAIRWIEHWLCWFEERSQSVISGALQTPEVTGATIEKLYFGGPGTADWPALARIGDLFVPALSPNHIFVPG